MVVNVVRVAVIVVLVRSYYGREALSNNGSKKKYEIFMELLRTSTSKLAHIVTKHHCKEYHS